MPDLSKYPARISRSVAMQLLCVNRKTFKKVVDANPQLRHRLPGEQRDKYLTAEIAKLLSPRCATVWGGVLADGQQGQTGKMNPKSNRT